MTDLQAEIAEMFRQEHEKQKQSSEKAVRHYREFMVRFCQIKGARSRPKKAKTPRVRQHPRGKQK